MRSKLFIGLLGLSISLNVLAKTGSFKGGDELDNLKNSTLVVVLLEENPKYIDKLNKAHKVAAINAYKASIKTINDNMQATASKYLTMVKGVEFMPMSQIVDLPEATRESYSYLVYDRATQFSNGGSSNFEFDFYIDKADERKAMLSDYLDFINFDCADPKYHGEDDYRRMQIIVEGKKHANEEIFTQSLDMIIPTEGSFALCFTGLQKQYEDAMATPAKTSKEQMKTDIREKVAKARTRTLYICKDNVEKNVTEAKIGVEFKYKFKIVPRDEFDKAILNKDTVCLLVVYPDSKTNSGYRPTVNYQHLIYDAETGDVLLTVVPPPAAGGGMPISYQKINDKSFKDLVKEEDEVTK
jgi:hypothetical protein